MNVIGYLWDRIDASGRRGQCPRTPLDDHSAVTRRVAEWTGITRRELRTQEKQTLVDCRGVSHLTFGAAGRKFALLGDQLVDEARIPVLYVAGKQYSHIHGASIRFPDKGQL